MAKFRLARVSAGFRNRLQANKRGNWRDYHIKRQHNFCFYCKRPMKYPTLDHKDPLSRGGEDNFDNTCAACKWCNQTKGSLNETEFRRYLHEQGYLEQDHAEDRVD